MMAFEMPPHIYRGGKNNNARARIIAMRQRILHIECVIEEMQDKKTLLEHEISILEKELEDS